MSMTNIISKGEYISFLALKSPQMHDDFLLYTNRSESIIDWGFARKLPLQFGLGFPRFLSIEPPTDLNEAPPACLREFISEYFRVSAILQARYWNCTQKRASERDQYRAPEAAILWAKIAWGPCALSTCDNWFPQARERI